MSDERTALLKHTLQFKLLAIFLALVFVTGGSSRMDDVQLMILRPFSVLFFGVALLIVRTEHLVKGKPLLIFVGGVVPLAIAFVVPLPSEWSSALPGREITSSIDVASGMAANWRPLTSTPLNGVNALFALVAPITILLFAIQLNRLDRSRTIILLISLIGLSALIGLAQTVSNPNGPLYFYRITNNGSPVGLLANRNHAATLLACLFPLLAVFASEGPDQQRKIRQIGSVAVAVVLVPLILVVGSRSGLLAAGIAIASVGFLYRGSTKSELTASLSKYRALTYKGGGALLLAIGLGFITLFFSRAVAVDRLMDLNAGEDGRAAILAVSTKLIPDYLPLGSGSGSFVEVYKLAEPVQALYPAFINHAHSDWVETAILFGVPGICLMLIALFFYVIASIKVWRGRQQVKHSVAYARMASVVIAIIGIASLSDYPLRTPLISSVFIIMSVLLLNGSRASDAEAKS